MSGSLDQMRPDDGEMRRARLGLLVLMSVLLLVSISVLLALSFRDRGAVKSQYVGVWSLLHSDGTTEDVRLNADGTISANDDYVYRWAADQAAVRVVAYEQMPISIRNPTSFFRYLFPYKSESILTPRSAEEESDMVLVGNGVELRRVSDAD